MKKNCVICGHEFDAPGGQKTCGQKCSHLRRKETCREHARKWLLDPKNQARNRERARQWSLDPKNRERRRQSVRQRARDPRVRERFNNWRREWLLDPKNRERNRERSREYSRKRRLDPKYREKVNKSQREWYRKFGRDPKHVARKRELGIKSRLDPKNRERERERQRARVLDPKYRERARERAREYARQRRLDPKKHEMYRERFNNWRREWRHDPKNRERMREEYRQSMLDPKNRERRRFSILKCHRKSGPISKKTQAFFLTMNFSETSKNINEPKEMKNQPALKVPTVQQFIESMNMKFKSIKDSCDDLVLMVDADPDVFEKIIQAEPRYNYNMLESMRKVGKGELYCELLFDPSLAARRLLPLPAAQQKKLYNSPIKILRLVGGKHVVEEKMLQKLSRHELNLLIDHENGRARTVDEQMAYVAPPPPAKRAERYQIVGDRLRVMAETEFSAEQLRTILERMDSQNLNSLSGSIKGNQLKTPPGR